MPLVVFRSGGSAAPCESVDWHGRGGGRLLESLTLRQQAAANSEEQFANSPDFAKERMSAIIGALAAHRTVRSQALNSKDVQQGIKDILLNYTSLYEDLRNAV